MMNFTFFNPTKLIFGSGKLSELGNQPMPGKKAMLLISNGKSTKVNGSFDRVIAQLQQAGVDDDAAHEYDRQTLHGAFHERLSS